MMRIIFFQLLLSAALSLCAQPYTRQDSLRGSITPERAWWDLLHYDLSVRVDPESRTIRGSNTIRYRVLAAGTELQIDLQEPLVITSVTQNGKQLNVRSDGNAHFIQFQSPQQIGETYEVTISYEGVPKVAERAPWDGGFSWDKDENGKHFIATSCQGLGASVWWPCKDHMYDENDEGMTMRFTVPADLVAVGNGRLVSQTKNKDKTTTWVWRVTLPINNYGVNVNIGDYVSFGETYAGEKGPLDMNYYVLRDNLKKAKLHFADAIRTMEALEHWFGPYPFYEDSYKLVEVPYLGMEHQSSVTYGNGYIKGYRGYDLSQTGWGLEWDYIIIHETGHEWFANNITYRDIADMWVHESFTTYSESLFIEYFYGKEAAAEYVRGMRRGIANQEPMIGNYGVNDRGADLYNKGSNLLHTLRQLVGDDEKWRAILRGLNEEFYLKTVTSAEIETYIAQQSGLNLTVFFDQYLRDPRVPVLEYFNNEQGWFARWTNCIPGFDMPVTVLADGATYRINPTTRWTKTEIPTQVTSIETDPDYYIYTSNLKTK